MGTKEDHDLLININANVEHLKKDFYKHIERHHTGVDKNKLLLVAILLVLSALTGIKML
jgi:hypothetical protein